MKVDILVGDVRDRLKDLPDGSVHCCVTSPPYWGLRKYLGDPGMIGMEPTFAIHMDNLLTVFREVRRVLRDDGVLIVNYGDAYAGGGRGNAPANPDSKQATSRGSHGSVSLGRLQHNNAGANDVQEHQTGWKQGNWKAKDLMMMPARVAIAMQEDGWGLHSMIPICKRNPMPESVRGRPTNAVEYMFLFSKGSKRRYWTHQWLPGLRSKKPAPDHFWRNKITHEETDDEPEGWRELLTPDGKRKLWTRLNRWTGHDYFWDDVAVRTPIKAETTKYPDGWDTGPGAHGTVHREGREKGAKTTQYDKEYEPGEGKDFKEAGVQDGREIKARIVKSVRDKQRGHGRRHDGFNDRWDSMTKEEQQAAGANMRNFMISSTYSYKGSHFACVDEGTEALTSSGWKRHSELKLGDTIAGYDIETGRLKWDVEDQDMVRLKGRTVDQLMTPNHRCLIQTVPGNRHVVRADQLKESQRCLVAADWIERSDAVEIPETLAALLGWFVTEGNIGEHHVNIYQSASYNPRYCEEIRSLLKREGATFMEWCRPAKYRGRDSISVTWRVTGSVANILLSMSPNKRLPHDFLNWNRMSLMYLWDAIIKGDGHFRDFERATFIQNDKVLADQVQALASRLGFSSTMSLRKGGSYAVYKTVRKRRVLRSKTSKIIGSEKYSGLVWCPKTETGFWMARRNNRTFITGNTFNPEWIEPFIKAGSSEKGCCPACGAPWERQTVTPQPPEELRDRSDDRKMSFHTRHIGGGQKIQDWKNANPTRTTGWTPTCECDAGDPVPCVILDPFAGSGTTGMVAARLQRDSVLIEISPEYAEMARKRIEDDAPLLTKVDVK